VISRHLRNLEEWTEAKLVMSQGRGLALTEEGERFYARITRAFDMIATATNELSIGKRQTLEINCMPGLADRVLLDGLPFLQAKLPNWEIILRPTIDRTNLLTGAIVVEIVYCKDLSSRSGVNSQLLTEPRVFPVTTPVLRSRLPEIRTVGDLIHAPLLHEESTQYWADWLRKAGLEDFPALRGPRLWHADVAIQAARQNQGIALANEILVRDDLERGTLVELLSSSVRLGGYFIASSVEHWDGHAVIATREWVTTLLISSSVQLSHQIGAN
jgi:DNA-binding transcriptional LysR family regulator